ncbi:MAG: response regulator [Kiritimatiellae bacterium]|nr:response regulator [Kiritimatiellia bacterium]MDD4735799.1 response regulator [Kiritimatiellia bacterium]
MSDKETVAKLEHMNFELSKQLVQSERMRSLGTLSAGVAHHFNNLLSVILGYSSYILNRENLSSEATDALQKISEAAQRGRRLTDEILAFAGNESEEFKGYRVHETLLSVLSLLELQTSGQIEVSTELAAENDYVAAPQSALHQIVFNLITNAIDSMPAGGTLTIRTANVAMSGDQPGQDYLRLEVEDSGGLVFDTPESDEGFQMKDRAGVKLSSVYGIVGKMEGTVLMTSKPGASARIEVLLPTAQPDSPGSQPKPVSKKLDASLIWVVDDNPTFREMCEVVLAEEKHTIHKLSCGEQLHKYWKENAQKPDLLLIDFSMPDYNGLELVEWLIEQKSTVPVILVSGLSEDQPDIRQALSNRRVHFLQKPFAASELADMVNVALGENLLEQ